MPETGACGNPRVMPHSHAHARSEEHLMQDQEHAHRAPQAQQAPKHHDVVIAGGGPTGMMLAGELALAHMDVAIVEGGANQEIEGSRAGGLLSRTLEVLDQRGIVERFLSQGKKMEMAGFYASISLDASDFPTRHPFGLALWQSHIERILGAWIAELRVPVYRE